MHRVWLPRTLGSMPLAAGMVKIQAYSSITEKVHWGWEPTSGPLNANE
jgi:hypothetical protein